MSPRILAVVVNFRTPDLAIDCLGSLVREQAASPGLEIVLVDNGSGDGSADRIDGWIREQGLSGVSVLRLPRNLGFAAGNNAAIRPALAAAEPPRYCFLLNSDTVVQPGAVQALVRFLEGCPGAGLAASRLDHPDGRWQESAFRFPHLLHEIEGGLQLGLVSRLLARWSAGLPFRDEPFRADWVAAAALLVRREVFDAIGLLDESYFLYFEDVDLCRRARRAGWESWYVPTSRVVHLLGRSSGFVAGRPAPLPVDWLISRRRYYLKHHGPARLLAADLLHLLGLSLRQARTLLQPGFRPDAPERLRRFLRYSCFRRGVVSP